MDTELNERPTTTPVRRWIRILGWTVAGGFLVAAIWYGATIAATYAAIAKYTPQDGDVIFQSLPYGPVVWAIEGVTKSPYSHCGIVAGSSANVTASGLCMKRLAPYALRP
ncbi:MAG: hypothetical protein NTY25_00090 [Planctomycetia bacterium]|nr:hypothetical protein [Planctomycetia bacterium]